MVRHWDIGRPGAILPVAFLLFRRNRLPHRLMRLSLMLQSRLNKDLSRPPATLASTTHLDYGVEAEFEFSSQASFRQPLYSKLPEPVKLEVS